MHNMHPSQLPPDSPADDHRPIATVHALPIRIARPFKNSLSATHDGQQTVLSGDGKPWQRVFAGTWMRSVPNGVEYTDGEFFVDRP